MRELLHQRFGGILALAALALQIVLSFGHFHPEATARVSIASAAVTAASVTSQQIPAPLAGDPDDYCAICASNALVSTSFVPDVAPLPLPADFNPVAPRIPVTFGSVIDTRRAAFRSRAPPRA